MEGRISTTSIGQGELAQVGVMEAWEKGVLSYVFSWEEEENECVCVWEELIFMYEKMLFMEKNVCKQKSIEGSYV